MKQPQHSNSGSAGASSREHFRVIHSIIGDEGILANEEVCMWEGALRSGARDWHGGRVDGAEEDDDAGRKPVTMGDIARLDSSYTCGLLLNIEELLTLVVPVLCPCACMAVCFDWLLLSLRTTVWGQQK